MKLLAPILGLGLAWGLSTASAEEKKDSSPPTLQAVIAKTPEEKAKVKSQLSSYPLKTCLVSGDELGGMGETINALYGDRLIRFCCKGCLRSFNKNPAKFLPKLDSPAKSAS